MEKALTFQEIKKEIRTAAKHIKQANKGLPWPVKINKDFSVFPSDCGLTLQIHYTDGDLNSQVYNVLV